MRTVSSVYARSMLMDLEQYKSKAVVINNGMNDETEEGLEAAAAWNEHDLEKLLDEYKDCYVPAYVVIKYVQEVVLHEQNEYVKHLGK